MKSTNKIYAVIDTNVLVSALYSKNRASNPGIIIDKILEGIIIPLYNNEILEEYKEVLTRTKFSFNKQLIENLLLLFTNNGIQITNSKAIDEFFPDKSDKKFYEIKMSVDDSYLVTGNTKHFPKITFVVTPAQMVEIINKLLL